MSVALPPRATAAALVVLAGLTCSALATTSTAATAAAREDSGRITNVIYLLLAWASPRYRRWRVTQK